MKRDKPSCVGMNVLIVVADRQEAISAGANGVTLHHRSSPECQFWWPSLGTFPVLEGRKFDMIVVVPMLKVELWTWLRTYACRPDTIWVEGGKVMKRGG